MTTQHKKSIKKRSKIISQAIALDDNNADAYYAKGFTLVQENKSKAIEAYQKAAKLYQEPEKTNYFQSAQKQLERLKENQ